MKAHKYHESLERGLAWERRLDAHFGATYAVADVEMGLQVLGIDRVFVDPSNGWRMTVEYKADERAKETGNAFFETSPNKEGRVGGWVYTTCAQRVVYYFPHLGRAMIFDPVVARKNMRHLRSCYGAVELVDSRRGKTRTAVGVPVPIKYLEGQDWVRWVDVAHAEQSR